MWTVDLGLHFSTGPNSSCSSGAGHGGKSSEVGFVRLSGIIGKPNEFGVSGSGFSGLSSAESVLNMQIRVSKNRMTYFVTYRNKSVDNNPP
jgi:hypothetical protein